MSTNVFISYSRVDGQVHAETLYQKLSAAGFEAWRDERSLNPYVDFSAQIESAIRRATHVVVCVTPAVEATPSCFVRREILYAQSKGKPILPLIYDGATIPVLINDLLWIAIQNLDDDFASVVESLSAILPSAQSDEDPYNRYLTALLDQIVHFLETTTFSYIPIRSHSDLSAISGAGAHVPVKLVSLPLTVKQHAKSHLMTRRMFEHFKQAYEHYSGSLLLLGDPGSGKSTTLWAFAREAVLARLADPSQPLPLLAQVASWNPETQATVFDWLSNTVGFLERQELLQAIESHNILLLLDGLDELGPVRVERVSQQEYDPRLRLIHLLPKECKQVVTCRTKDYLQIGETMTLNGAVVLQPLDATEIEIYLRDQPRVYARISSDAVLLEAAGNPLVLSLLAYAFLNVDDDSYDLHSFERPSVIHRVVNIFLRRRYEHETLKPNAYLPFTLSEVRMILGYLALLSLRSDYSRRDAHVIDLVDVKIAFYFLRVANENQRAEDFLEIASRLHILLPNFDNTYRFLHLVIRDTLAVTVLVPLLFHQESWERKLALQYLERLPHQDQITQPLLEFLEFETVSRNQEIALKALGKTGDVQVCPVLVAAITNGGSRLKEIALASLRELGAETLDVWIQLLKSGSQDVRCEAARWLGRRQEKSSVSALISALHDSDPDVRSRVADALGEIGDDRATAPLISLLEDFERRVRLSAIRALGELCDHTAVETLIRCLSDENEMVRGYAAKALGKIGDPRAFERLSTLLKSSNKEDRGAAAKALGYFGHRNGVEILLEALNDDDVWVRSTILKSLGMLGDLRAWRAVKDATSDEWSEVRYEALAALWEIDSDQAVPTLIEHRFDTGPSWDDDYICFAVLSALRTARTPEALAAIKEMESFLFGRE